MPDHEEAVREARDALVLSGLRERRVHEFERVIRASERARYAALVEAVRVRHVGMHGSYSILLCSDPMCAALAILSEEEPT